MDNETRLDRLEIAEGKLIEAYQHLDPNSPTYFKDALVVAKLHKELAEDIKNLKENEAKQAETDVEKQHLEEEERNNRSKDRLDIIGKVVLVGTTAATVGSQLWMFKRSTEKEKDEVLDTTTKRTVVSNGLSGRFFRFFNK
jgi:chromosome condensin MukBEF MukE localization factor